MSVKEPIERPSEYMLATRDVVAFGVHGRPRDPEDGTHRQVAIFAEPTMTPSRLAGYLLDAARLLNPR